MINFIGTLMPCVAYVGVMSLVVTFSGVLATDAGATSVPSLYRQLEVFHGHVCAGSLLGVRLGLAAKEGLQSVGGKGRLKAAYYSISCPVDGIQVAVGTTCGNKSLEIKEQGKHHLVLTAVGNGRTVVARLTKKAEKLARQSRDLGAKVRALSAEDPERLRQERELEEMYVWLKTAPAEEIVVVSPLTGSKGDY